MTKEKIKKQLLLSLEMWENGDVLECADSLKKLANEIINEAEEVLEND